MDADGDAAQVMADVRFPVDSAGLTPYKVPLSLPLTVATAALRRSQGLSGGCGSSPSHGSFKPVKLRTIYAQPTPALP